MCILLSLFFKVTYYTSIMQNGKEEMTSERQSEGEDGRVMKVNQEKKQLLPQRNLLSTILNTKRFISNNTSILEKNIAWKITVSISETQTVLCLKTTLRNQCAFMATFSQESFDYVTQQLNEHNNTSFNITLVTKDTLKPALINICILTIGQITLCNVKGMLHMNLQNYQPSRAF